jgi:hypothetical protein
MVEGDSFCPRCGIRLPADHSAKALAIASSIIGAACAFASAAVLILDFVQNRHFGWSIIVLASCVLAWILIGFPMLVYLRPALFLPVMGLASLAYLWILEKLTGGGWFTAIALPIALASMASAAMSVWLCAKVKRRGPNIAAFILVGCTLDCIAVEAVLSLHDTGKVCLSWSVVVAVTSLFVAALLLRIQHRLRQAN